MNLTKKQKSFISHYYATLGEKNAVVTVEQMVEVFVVLYLEANDNYEREKAAYFISMIHPKEKLTGFEELIDVQELYKYAAAKQKRMQNGAKEAQERRHRERGDFSLTDSEWEKAVHYFDNECAYCGKRNKLTFEHVVPFSKGGSFDKKNIIPACTECNSSKNDKDFSVWYRNQLFYDETREQRIITYLSQVNELSSKLSS